MNGMHDMVGVNCDCAEGTDRSEDDQNGCSEILVPDDDNGLIESISSTRSEEENKQEASCCTDCGTELKWKLRLSGMTVQVCPNC